MAKLLRLTTVPVSLKILLRGQLSFMKQYFNVVGVSSPGPDLEMVNRLEGIQTLPIEMTRDISLVKDLFALWKLIRLFCKEKPQIVHTHTPKAGTLGMIAACFCGIPIRLHTVAGLPLMEATGPKRVILNTVEKITYACATKVYPNSFGLKNFILQNNYCNASKLKVIGNGSSNGIDTAHFAPNTIDPVIKEQLVEVHGITQDHFVFIFIGRMVTDKGINELVQAFTKVHQQYPHTRLLLVGNAEPELDPLLPETEQLIESHPAIITTGFQSDVRPYLAIANALVFPSYREGFPNVPMQAGAMGLPAIVTDINGCNEIIQHEFNGLIIPSKDTNALVASMSRLIAEPNLTDSLAANARESIVSRFDRHILWNQIREEYEKQLRIHGLLNANLHQ